MKYIFLIVLVFISVNVFGQSNPYTPTTTTKGFLPPNGSNNSFLQMIGSTPTWAFNPGNPTLYVATQYGCVNDGQFARHASSTASSSTITCLSCKFLTTAVAGQSFRMDSAGASGAALITTILSVTDNTHIVLNTTAGTSVTSKDIVWGTDNGAAIENLLDTIFVHKGGTAYFPQGGYIISRALQTSRGGWNPNCQIPLPTASIGDTTFNYRTGIAITGVAIPSYLVKSFASDTINAHNGTWFESTIDAADPALNVLMPAVFGTIASNADINYNIFYFYNLTLFVPQNSGSGGPQIGGINCYECAAPEFQNMVVTSEGSLGNSSQPTHEMAGIITNKDGSETETYLHNVVISGFKYALVESDHVINDNVQLFGDFYGQVITQSAYPISDLKIGIQECAHNIYVPNYNNFLGTINKGACQLIGTVQIEKYSPSAWWQTVDDIVDSGNNCTANIQYFSNVSGVITKVFGTNFILQRLGRFGNYTDAFTDNLVLGDLTTTTTSNVTINSNANSNHMGLVLGNANTNSGNIENIQFWNDLNGAPAVNHGVFLGLLGNTSGAPFNSAFRIFDFDGPVYIGGSGTRRAFIGTGGVSLGDNAVATTQGYLESTATTTQLALHYDASHYTTFTTGSGGIGTIAPTGTQLNITGHLAPTTNITYDLGTSSLAWRDIYFSHTISESAMGASNSLGSNVSSATASGSDEDFQLTIVTSGAVAGTIADMTFGRTWIARPHCTISSANAATGSAVAVTVGGYIAGNATSTSNWEMSGAITAAGTYVVNCHCGQ